MYKIFGYANEIIWGRTVRILWQDRKGHNTYKSYGVFLCGVYVSIMVRNKGMDND